MFYSNGFRTIFSIKGKWQQKFHSSQLKEIQKQYIEVYYKVFEVNVFRVCYFYFGSYENGVSKTIVDLTDI